MTKQTATILASRYYLVTELPENYETLNPEKLDEFLEANAWLPFECYLASVLWEYIDDLADEFVRVSK